MSRHLAAPPTNAESDAIIEFSVATTGTLEVCEVTDREPGATLADRAGTYRVRISSRAVHKIESSHAERDNDPVESYLIEAWPAPSAPPSVLRSDATHRASVLVRPSLIEPALTARALAAAAAIGAAIDGGHTAAGLSGERAQLRTERTMPGQRPGLLRSFAHMESWTHRHCGGESWTGAGRRRGYSVGQWQFGMAHTSRDQLSGRYGAIRSSIVAYEADDRVVRAWNWVRRPSAAGGSVFEWPAVLGSDSLLTVRVRHSSDADAPTSTVQLTHSGLPIEWLPDMDLWWQLQLAIADAYGLGDRDAGKEVI